LIEGDNYYEGQFLFLAAFATDIASAQNQPVLGEEAVKVSDHVWAVMGFPNIAIVVGTRATLIVDTGLGAASTALSLPFSA
jgi:hypothetical protein